MKDADAGDGGVIAVQSGALNISIANTYSYDAEGNIRPFNLGLQTANPRIMVGVKNDLTSSRGDYFVKYNGNQLTPDLGQANWAVVSGGRVGTAQNYTFYEIQLTGVTMNAGAVALENIGQIDSRLIPHSAIDSRVEDYALRGKANRVPVERLTQDIPEAQLDSGTRAKLNARGLGQTAVDARIQAAKANLAPLMVGWIRDGAYEPGDALIGNSARWAAMNHRHRLQPSRRHFGTRFAARLELHNQDRIRNRSGRFAADNGSAYDAGASGGGRGADIRHTRRRRRTSRRAW